MTFKSEANPQFRNQLSETIFNQKYRHEGAETWGRLAALLVDSVCKDRLTKDDKEDLVRAITDLKFIPGGRYLYYAGRPVKFYNNCLGRGTKVLTTMGWRNVEDLGEADVISPVDGLPYYATFNSHGIQPLYEITFAPLRGKSKIRYKVRATKNHRWRLADGTSTWDLGVGDVVPNGHGVKEKDGLGFVHGFVFGDGNRNGQLRLCADKDKQYLPELSKWGSVTYPPSANGDPVLYFGQKINWKELPTATNPEYISEFIRGWIAADGCKNHLLCSVKREHLEWFRENAAMAGITITGNLRSQTRDVALGNKFYKDHEIFIQNFSYASPGLKVESIEYVGDEEVFCPFEEVHNQIIIDHNIHTYQCYLLKAEEDSREDWADLSWKSESCLLTGGGIGIDYSVYRPSGTIIRRTGGYASGPIPKMMMINEIGRHVMQGGSRRSAIYASLSWQHADAEQFLHIKDWYSQLVPGTGVSIGQVREKDFNFPAPLDMTNISLNYDTAWVMKAMTGDYGALFRENVKQAMMTGEPGFSFNFFDKENETLRNAYVCVRLH